MTEVFRSAFAARLVELLSAPDRTWVVEADGRLVSSDDDRTAEIRIDGEPSRDASAVLRDLDWKTPPEFALARCYGLFIPTEAPPG